MSDDKIKLLDTVALVEPMPEAGLLRGHVGTVVEVLAADVFQVEFSDEFGRTYALQTVKAENLLPLIHHSVPTA